VDAIGTTTGLVRIGEHDWKYFDADTDKDLACEVREYYILDFSTWKGHDGFEATFAWLLKDLRAEEPKAAS